MGRGAMGTARAEAARDEAPTPTREDEKAKGAAADAKKRKAPATWQETMRDAKAKHRPRLKDWSRDGFATRRRADFKALSEIDAAHVGETIQRVDAADLTPERFASKFERASEPVIVRGVPDREAWGARAWTCGGLAEDGELGAARLKCGEDDDGHTVRVSLRDFASYCAHDADGDDSPLYVFDGAFAERAAAKGLAGGYGVPAFCGRDDLFELVGEELRPPYRWLLLGPKRSGTCVHVDPLGTSAWNTVIKGRKRWVLFEPGTSKRVASGKPLVKPGEDDEAINYFADILPRVRTAHPTARRYECIQEPGETIFVPGGWWHAVLNLDDTVGVTQNFASRENFDAVWDKTRVGRKAMARRWYRALGGHADADVRALKDRASIQPPIAKPGVPLERPKPPAPPV
mmetsp:Transcript_613/g.1814  ORF Transcript_613/g.1814 Transcript_613/m.1814 type:complete len:403 (+) Transcript_613:203-1411(+)